MKVYRHSRRVLAPTFLDASLNPLYTLVKERETWL
jgi:hypothetical protein